MAVRNRLSGGRWTKRSFRRFFGAIVLVTVLISALALIVSLAIGIYPLRTGGFAVVAREPYTHSYDPIALIETGLAPQEMPNDASQIAGLPKDPEAKYISIRPDAVSLHSAGVVIRTISTPQPVTDLQKLNDLLADPAWLEQPNAGEMLLKAALVTYSGVDFTIGAPIVSDVGMLSLPSVFIGTRGGQLRFDRVRVHSVPVENLAAGHYRPFVVATDDATMRILDSQMVDLGWDWNASYGVSWEQGASGEAINTAFERNFIGAYTGRSTGMVFRGCIFRNNALYGLDPHTYSKNLTVDNVLAENNKAHGIIFSDYVRDSVIMNSISRNNGENGIMMDKHSSGNAIFNNTVTGNKGDGLVTALSPNNLFAVNTVEKNRIGVRVSPTDARTTVLTGNRFSHNAYANENILLPSSNSATSNGGQWNWVVIKQIWVTAAIWLGVSAFALAFPIFRRRPDPFRRLAPV